MPCLYPRGAYLLPKNHSGVKFRMDERTILTAIASGAKGYVDEAESTSNLVQAIYAVHHGSVWIPRRVMSIFIERTSDLVRCKPVAYTTFTSRQKQVLQILVAGRSNKEIGVPLGIKERTVKSHVAKLMRMVGVRNRIALSTYAITNSLVSAQGEGISPDHY